MKLSDYKEEYYEFSKLASENARKAAFAGIAIVWIFRVTSGATPQIPRGFLGPVICFVVAIGVDLLHYILGSVIWGRFHAYHEGKLTDVQEDPEMSHPTYLEYPITACFVLKLA